MKIGTPILTSYDLIILNTSGGKDSQVMIETVSRMAKDLDILDRLLAVHCDLGRAEWAGTRKLAEQQAQACGVLRFEVVSRPQGDLLAQIEARGMFPSSTARYCTSDQKTGQVRKVITRLHRESGQPEYRVLNCLGIRSQESSARAKKSPFRINSKASTRRRRVDDWLTIFKMTEDEVWAAIRKSGVPYHKAYGLGMSRLSCVFCVLASKRDLVTAATHNRPLLEQYVKLEKRIEHRFTFALSAKELQALTEGGAG